MVGLLDIYSGVYIDVIVSMVCTDLYRWSNQTVNCLSKVSACTIVYKGCMGSVTTW